MKLGLKITSVAFALALLTACGGGGGGGGGGGNGNPDPGGGNGGERQLPSWIKNTPVPNTNGTSSSYLSETPVGVEEATVVTYDLDTNSVDSPEYSGFTLYRGIAMADTDGDDQVDSPVQVYAIRYGDSTNRTVATTNGQMTTPGNGSALMLFDSSGGVGAGGADLDGLPTGTQTYKGYNFFRYTTSAQGQQQSLQSGTFTFNADFANGTGTLTSETSSSVGTGTTDITYAGTKITNQSVTIFTTGNTAGTFQGDISVVPTTRTGTGNPTDGTALTANIYGSFHGKDGVGIAGQYHGPNRTFQGAIAGDVGANP